MILTNVYKLKIQYCILKSLTIKCFTYTNIMLFSYELHSLLPEIHLLTYAKLTLTMKNLIKILFLMFL